MEFRPSVQGMRGDEGDRDEVLEPRIKYFVATVIPVVILCGGKGTRMRAGRERLPKPLVEIGGRPILWHVMSLYAAQGFVDRKSTRLNSSHANISYAVFCLKKTLTP